MGSTSAGTNVMTPLTTHSMVASTALFSQVSPASMELARLPQSATRSAEMVSTSATTLATTAIRLTTTVALPSAHSKKAGHARLVLKKRLQFARQCVVTASLFTMRSAMITTSLTMTGKSIQN